MTQTSQKKNLTENAKAYLQAHYLEKFSLDQVADALFINKNYLARVFKETTGHTLLWYHNSLRCEAAKRLLQEDGDSLATVAYKTGFASASHFSRIFKHFVGCTPTEYRRNQLR